MFTKKKLFIGAAALSVVVCALTLLVTNLLAANGIVLGGGNAQQMRRLNQALTLVEKNYYEEVDASQLVDGAISGMMATLDDPYSTYFTQEQYAEYTNYIAGEISGIGVSCRYDAQAGMLQVRSIFANSPAEQAGLRVDDYIAQVDGEDVVGEASEVVIAKVRGDAGSTVTLGLLRDGESVTASLVRAVVEVPQVTSELLEEGVGYIRLESFLGECVQQVEAAVADLESRGATGVVLDLRDNGGGLFTAGVDIADYFMQEGTIVSTKGRNGVEDVWSSDAAWDDVSLVLLVNEGTASASEILAGALQDSDRAKLVGTVTFGKGVVQSVAMLEQGGIKLTTAQYFTPSGKSINGSGITPDVLVDWTDEQKNNPSEITHATDGQLQAAIQTLKGQPVTQ